MDVDISENEIRPDPTDADVEATLREVGAFLDDRSRCWNARWIWCGQRCERDAARELFAGRIDSLDPSSWMLLLEP